MGIDHVRNQCHTFAMIFGYDTDIYRLLIGMVSKYDYTKV